MKPTALSTSVCDLRSVDIALTRWLDLAQGHGFGLSTDARMPLAFQRELLLDTKRRAIEVLSVAIPAPFLGGGIPSGRCPNVLADDRSERAAAGELWLKTVALAERCDSPHVLLLPPSIELYLPIGELLQLFMAGDELPLEELYRQRESLTPECLDYLRAGLDPILERCAGAGISLDVAGPAVWPHQFPRKSELESLVAEFSGAPLATAAFSDWFHMAELVDPSPVDDEASEAPLLTDLPLEIVEILAKSATRLEDVPIIGQANAPLEEAPETRSPRLSQPPLAQLRLADASGLLGHIPPGSGELCWESFFQSIDGTVPSLSVLSSDQALNQAELNRTLEILARHP